MLVINPGKYASPLLSQHRIAVSVVGQHVRLELGNTLVDMPYEVALQLSQWLRVNAKRAKGIAGDSSREWRIIATIDAK